MGASSKLFLEIREREFEQIDSSIREKFSIMKVEPDDYEELFKNDPTHSALMKNYKKASKELRDYKFDKRHNS